MSPRRVELQILKLRSIAEPVGPMHAYWELIFDLEAILRGEIRGPAAEAVIASADRALEGGNGQ